ncbi:MAG: 4'-phosphopantetheinyl transferase superfamily protein [Clostridia bacterium]|nr:4'-phosphopantetheinyl transferase superfamily protein [Clostridia bacterium]
MTKVFYLDALCFSNASLFNAAIGLLPYHRKEKLRRIKNTKEKYLCVGAWLLLEKALKTFPSYNGDGILNKTSKGKPFFLNYDSLHFSLSHSGNIALCAVSDKKIGADIQLMGDFTVGICKKYFSQNEADYVLSAPSSDEKTKRFFRIWTLKEAFSKMTGDGLSGFKKFSVKPGGEVIAEGENLPEAFFKEFTIDDYKIAICTEGYEDDFEIKKLNLSEILIN